MGVLWGIIDYEVYPTIVRIIKKFDDDEDN